MLRPRSLIRASILTLGISVGLAWAAWAYRQVERYRDAMTQVETEMAEGRFATASRNLNRVLGRYPRSDEAAFLLGNCERQLGRAEAAETAWARITPGSVFEYPALLGRVRLCHDSGRFSVAEQLIATAARDPRNEHAQTWCLLVPIYSQIGEVGEAERVIEAEWAELNRNGEGASERALDLVRMHIELTFHPNPVENVRGILERAHRLDPNDDRVWLGLANLAIRLADYDEARQWLDDCLKRRPEDPAVWHALLDLGVATGSVNLTAKAIERLRGLRTKTVNSQRAEAWLAGRQGNVEAEVAKLERALALAPDDLPALDRLITLCERQRREVRVAQLRAQKAEMARARNRYIQLFDRFQPIRDAVEMADLAIKLGRPFEARAFLTVAVAEDPERLDLKDKIANVPLGL